MPCGVDGRVTGGRELFAGSVVYIGRAVGPGGRIKTLTLAALAALVPALAAAQDPGKARLAQDRQALQKDSAAVKDQRRQSRDLSAQRKAARAALRDKEKAAVEAVRADASLDEPAKKAKVKAIHQDYRAQRKALEQRYAGRRDALRQGIRDGSERVGRDREAVREDRDALKKAAAPDAPK